MTLIKREDAIAKAKYLVNRWIGVTGKAYEEKVPLIEEVFNAISSAEAEWIPCSERLPSESDYYLVTNINAFGEKEVCVIWFAHKIDYGVSEWREITDQDTILAWMPLPKPYREDGEV